MMDREQSILSSLKDLSEAAAQSLPLFERYDYRKEAQRWEEENLPLDLLPKPLREIVDSVIQYCIDIRKDGRTIPSTALLGKKNMQLFLRNLDLTGDTAQTHMVQFIDIEPIKTVADYFSELGLQNQARLLGNVYEFADSLRSSNRRASFKAAGCKLPATTINFTVPPDELTEDELLAAQLYTDFCSVFKSGAFYPAQKRALYDAFRERINQDKDGKPHLVIMAAILLLKTKASFRAPFYGKLNHIRETIFLSLGQPKSTAKNYGEDSLKKGADKSLYNYKEEADELLKEALGTTR